MARARRGLGNFDEAKADLLTLLNDGKSKDPDDIERLYYEVGKTCLEGEDGREAVRYLSKALGISLPGDKTRIHDLIWRAYLKTGLKEKAQEHAQKAGVKRSDWIAACPDP
jgi:tetratricopeptide (TPR) repeat protein